MIPNQYSGRAEVKEDFEPDAIVAALKIVTPKVPLPGKTSHGPDGVTTLVKGNGAGFENQFVASREQPGAQVHILIIGAKFFVVATNTDDGLFAENRAKAAKSLVRRLLDVNPLKAKILRQLLGPPGIGRRGVVSLYQASSNAYDARINKVREKIFEPSMIGNDIRVDGSHERMGRITKSGVARGSETFVFFVTDDAHGKTRGQFHRVIR